MHKLHLGAMLRVRALLTAEQRQKPEDLKHGPEHEGPRPAAGVTDPTSAWTSRTTYPTLIEINRSFMQRK